MEGLTRIDLLIMKLELLHKFYIVKILYQELYNIRIDNKFRLSDLNLQCNLTFCIAFQKNSTPSQPGYNLIKLEMNSSPERMFDGVEMGANVSYGPMSSKPRRRETKLVTIKKEPKQNLLISVPSKSITDHLTNADCSLIPRHMSEMLHPNNTDIVHLRAFNDYWSAQMSHCAVCTNFALSANKVNKQMPVNWKLSKPINLPEESLIWVS